MYAEINTTNYKGIYKVIELIGSIVALEVNNKTMDFKLNEITRFCNEYGENYRLTKF